MAPSIRQDGDLSAETAPAAAQNGLRLFLLGRARRAHVRAHDRTEYSGQIWSGLQVDQQARPDALVAPGRIAAIDRFPLPVFRRQRAPRCAHACHPAQRFHEKTAMRVFAYAYERTGIQKRKDTEPLGIGGRPWENTQREISGRITAGAQDVQYINTA